LRILLVTRAGLLRYPNKYFSSAYGGIKTYPKLAGLFGWFWQKALAGLGNEVKPFIYYRCPAVDHFGRLNQFIHSWKQSLLARARLPIRLINRDLIRNALAYKPELVLIDAGELIYPETLSEIKKRSHAKIATWLLDDPFSQCWKNVIKSMPIYDFIFVFDPHYVDKFKQQGAAFVEYLPCACDPDIHKSFVLSQEESKELSSQLCFVGSVTSARIPVLKELCEFDLGIWTYSLNRLKEDPSLLGHYRGFAWGELMSKVFNASRIVFNLHHPQTAQGVNMKTFEIAGCAGFQLVDKRAQLNNLFEIGKEIVCFENIQDLKELIRYYLDRPQERKLIAVRAQQRAHREHTYKQRLSRLISTVEKAR
jgi:spore maturation protein CgeB